MLGTFLSEYIFGQNQIVWSDEPVHISGWEQSRIVHVGFECCAKSSELLRKRNFVISDVAEFQRMMSLPKLLPPFWPRHRHLIDQLCRLLFSIECCRKIPRDSRWRNKAKQRHF